LFSLLNTPRADIPCVLENHNPGETAQSMHLVTLHLTINISTKDPRVALDEADEAINQIIPIDPSKKLEKAVTKVKWVMDVLAPIAEVSVIAFRCTRLS
jgi:hypothetical protein